MYNLFFLYPLIVESSHLKKNIFLSTECYTLLDAKKTRLGAETHTNLGFSTLLIIYIHQ